MSLKPDLDAVSLGFSAKAAEYDALATTHPVVIWLRERVRGLVEDGLTPGAAILEINAGSGIDAAYFAAKGYRVHATDVAPGMLAAIADKASRPECGGRLSYQALSFSELERADGGPYDVVFSNLGGLNCTNDLATVTRALPALLRPGGRVVWVVMPPVCPWELAQVLRGHWRTAWRRLRPGGTLANVEGAAVPVWYHASGRVRRALWPAFETLSLRSFCLFCPPSFFDGFVARHPRPVRALMRLDDALGGRAPFNQAGDFYTIVARLRSP